MPRVAIERQVAEHVSDLLALPADQQECLSDVKSYPFTVSRPAASLDVSLSHQTLARTVELDSFVAGTALVRAGFRPAVLNMANAYNCGGAWCTSSGSQEEHLFRSSSLPLSLWPHRRADDDRMRGCGLPRAAVPRYPWSANCNVEYSPAVLVTRGPDGVALPPLQRPTLAVISAAAQDLKRSTFEPTLAREKCRSVLWTAAHNRHDAIVLGAFGCGGFRNEPNQIAQFFAELLAPGAEFGCCFKLVLFAIILSKRNVGAFSRIFPLLSVSRDPYQGGEQLQKQVLPGLLPDAGYEAPCLEKGGRCRLGVESGTECKAIPRQCSQAENREEISSTFARDAEVADAAQPARAIRDAQAQKNKALALCLRRSLSADAYQELKTLSLRFQRGEVDVRTFYNATTALLADHELVWSLIGAMPAQQEGRKSVLVAIHEKCTTRPATDRV